jgi:AraC-like DNA-binding protein
MSWYRGAFGFVATGGQTDQGGDLVAAIQGLPECRCDMAWPHGRADGSAATHTPAAARVPPGPVCVVSRDVTHRAAGGPIGHLIRVLLVAADRVRGIRSPTIDATGELAGQLVVRYSQVGLGSVAIGDVTFGTDAAVLCEDVGSQYYVHMPLSGRLRSRHRGVDLTASRGLAAVYRPEGGSFAGQWEAGCRALCITLDRSSVNSALTKMLGEQPSRDVGFDHTMDTGRGVAREWAELVVSLRRQLASSAGLLANPLVADPLAESIVHGFLLAAQHSYSDAVTSPGPFARPATVRTAVDLMESDPLTPWTVSMLATRCVVGVRTLQDGFRRHLGMSPMAYLRDVRLRGAHDELLAGDPAVDSVAATARRWGFGHLGRFAAVHEAKYGETPSYTLRTAFRGQSVALSGQWSINGRRRC